MQILGFYDTADNDSVRLKILKANNSIDNIYKKNNRFGRGGEEEEEESSTPKSGLRKKNKGRLNLLNIDKYDNKKEDDQSSYKKYRKERLKTELDEDEDLDNLLFKGKKYGKKTISKDLDNDNLKQKYNEAEGLYGSDKINSFKKHKGKKSIEQWEDDNNLFSKRNLTYKYSDTLMSNLSASLLRGMPTKIKIFKCVVWKNNDPTISEDTIKHILHRSGSQILERGGFVIKLPKEKVEKFNKDLI
jgi:hypothetical protein